MNCSKCCQSNPPNARFCRHCGDELNDASRQVATPAPEAVSASSAKEAQQKSGGFPRWALVSTVSLGTLVVMGGITITVVLMNHKPKAAVAATVPPAKGPLDVKTVIQRALPIRCLQVLDCRTLTGPARPPGRLQLPPFSH